MMSMCFALLGLVDPDHHEMSFQWLTISSISTEKLEVYLNTYIKKQNISFAFSAQKVLLKFHKNFFLNSALMDEFVRFSSKNIYKCRTISNTFAPNVNEKQSTASMATLPSQAFHVLTLHSFKSNELEIIAIFTARACTHTIATHLCLYVCRFG